MPKSFSSTNSIKAFFDKLGPSKSNDQRSVRKAICEAYNLKEESPELEFLIFAQLSNFQRLGQELEFSTIGADARRPYKKRIGSLSAVFQHPALYNRYHNAKVQNIDPNYDVLTILHDHLGIATSLSDHDVANIDRVTEYLKEAKNELIAASIPLHAKSLISSQIVKLIFVLEHIDVMGSDQIWEAASGAYVILEKEAAVAQDQKGSAFLRSLAIKAAAIAAILFSAEQSTKSVVKLVSHLRDGYDLIEKWQRDAIPKIEYGKSKSEQFEE